VLCQSMYRMLRFQAQGMTYDGIPSMYMFGECGIECSVEKPFSRRRQIGTTSPWTLVEQLVRHISKIVEVKTSLVDM
jgi:hypothetical protein